MKRKTKKKVSLLLVILVILIILFFVYKIIINNGVAKYINKEYRLYDDVDEVYFQTGSCIKFNKNKTFEESDCNDGYSSMPFSSEYCKKYSYNKLNSRLTFYCDCPEDDAKCQKRFVTKVIKWNENELILEYTDRNTNTKAIYK